MFQELKAFSNVKKRNYLENLKTKLKTKNEDDQLKTLNNLFTFDKNNAMYLSSDTRIDIENLLIEQYTFIFNNTNTTLTIIISSKFLIERRDKILDEYKINIYEKLINMLNVEDISLNYKMDIAENLTHPSVLDYYKNIGRDYIQRHGGVSTYDIPYLERMQRIQNGNQVLVENNNEDNRDIYNNGQNVHHPKITKIMKQSLEILEKDEIPLIFEENITYFKIFSTTNKFQERPQTYEDCYNLYIKDLSYFSQVPTAFKRIETDTAIFFPTTLTLKDIFQRVYNRINKSIHKKELLNRLKEELDEMKDTCATGHASRLLNILSGFPDVELKIQPEINDDLIKDINNLIEKYIKKEKQEYIDILLESMIEDKTEYHTYIDNKKDIFEKELEPQYLNLVTKDKFEKIFIECIDKIKEI